MKALSKSLEALNLQWRRSRSIHLAISSSLAPSSILKAQRLNCHHNLKTPLKGRRSSGLHLMFSSSLRHPKSPTQRLNHHNLKIPLHRRRSSSLHLAPSSILKDLSSSLKVPLRPPKGPLQPSACALTPCGSLGSCSKSTW